MIDIKGDRIDLRTCTNDEWHSIWKQYVADPLMDPNFYVYEKEKVNLLFQRNEERKDWYPVVGIFLKDGRAIGDLSFKRIDYEVGRCELGIALVNDIYKGLGYGTEAIKLAVTYAFHNLGLKYIYADTMGSNIRMQKIFEKLGFRFVDKEEHCYDMHDRWEDKLNYMLER